MLGHLAITIRKNILWQKVFVKFSLHKKFLVEIFGSLMKMCQLLSLLTESFREITLTKFFPQQMLLAERYCPHIGINPCYLAEVFLQYKANIKNLYVKANVGRFSHNHMIYLFSGIIFFVEVSPH